MSILAVDPTPGHRILDRIRDAARSEVERFGILGLRVTRVAKQAGSSVTQIYRHFDDRDGLLADVLGAAFHESTARHLDPIITRMIRGDITSIDQLADVVAQVPNMRNPRESGLMSQTLAFASSNQSFRARLDGIIAGFRERWNTACDVVETTMPECPPLNRDAVFYALVNAGLFVEPFGGDQILRHSDFRVLIGRLFVVD